MKKIEKGVVSLLTFSVMTLGLSAPLLQVSAEETSTEAETVNADDYSVYQDQLTYFVNDDDTVTIVSCYDTDTNGNDTSSIDVPEKIDGKKVVEIGEDCFKTLSKLTTVTLPDTITEISKGAFNGCETLSKINVPVNLKVIGDEAFYSCKALEEFELPDTLEKIGYQSFYDCEKLDHFTISKNVSEIGQYAFEGCVELKEITVDEKNENYKSSDGILYDKDMTTLIKYPEKHEGDNFKVPDTVTKIDNWAFVGCNTIKTIDLNNVKEIGEDAFYYCTELTKADIPEGVTELNGSVFGYCVKLEKVTIPSTLKKIGDYAYYCCLSLKELTIPDNVESIGTYAFFYCSNLKDVTVSANTSEIGLYALGYTFDSTNKKEVPVDGFKLTCEEGSPVYKYAVDNDLLAGKFNLFTSKVSVGSIKIYVWIIALAALIVLAGIILIIVLVKRSKEMSKIERENLKNYNKRKQAEKERLERQKKANLIKNKDKEEK